VGAPELSPPYDCDVLVVGAGPVGAALTLLLAQRGVRTIALDRSLDIYSLPRAVHFDHEIMRLFQQIGIAEEVRQHACDLPDYEFRTADGQVLMRISPPVETSSGWGAGYMFHQPGLERALRAALAATPMADLRLGWRFDALAQDADGVTAAVTGPAGPTTLRARYLVGCDGAWSPVRETIGGGLFDYQFDEPWLVVDVKVGDGARTPDINIQLCDPARPTTCVLSGPGRHRWEFMLLPGETAEAMVDEAVVRELIRPWDCGPVDVERTAVYRFHGLVARRWRAGRVLIAGDAAHQTPPFAGQGMCAGLRDAANLAWKVEAVLSGSASQDLLDTYQDEREPHVRSTIEIAVAMGRLVCTLDPGLAAARDASMLAQHRAGAPPAPPPAPSPFAKGCILQGAPAAGSLFPQPTVGWGADRLRMDDALGAGAWLISRRAQSPVHGLDALSLEDPALAPFRTALESWLDRHAVEAVLVRPDRYVFGAGEPMGMAAAWRAALTPLSAAA
jgi:3-(3-hydroxy-phenyl)propionate hydroxylase